MDGFTRVYIHVDTVLPNAVNQFFEKRFPRASDFDAVPGKKVPLERRFFLELTAYDRNWLNAPRLPIAAFSSPANAVLGHVNRCHRENEGRQGWQTFQAS